MPQAAVYDPKDLNRLDPYQSKQIHDALMKQLQSAPHAWLQQQFLREYPAGNPNMPDEARGMLLATAATQLMRQGVDPRAQGFDINQVYQTPSPAKVLPYNYMNQPQYQQAQQQPVTYAPPATLSGVIGDYRKQIQQTVRQKGTPLTGFLDPSKPNYGWVLPSLVGQQQPAQPTINLGGQLTPWGYMNGSRRRTMYGAGGGGLNLSNMMTARYF